MLILENVDGKTRFIAKEGDNEIDISDSVMLSGLFLDMATDTGIKCTCNLICNTRRKSG